MSDDDDLPDDTQEAAERKKARRQHALEAARRRRLAHVDALAGRIEALILERWANVHQFEQSTGLRSGTVREITRRDKAPRSDNLLAVAAALGVSVADLFVDIESQSLRRSYWDAAAVQRLRSAVETALLILRASRAVTDEQIVDLVETLVTCEQSAEALPRKLAEMLRGAGEKSDRK